jgi:dTDP-4-dehydrorhamnose 3,5-epimerase
MKRIAKNRTIASNAFLVPDPCMHITPTNLSGVFLVEPERLFDERGFFARTWCREEFAQAGLNGDWAQCNVSFNRKRGTLRGLHYQAAPHEEIKLVRCTRGAVFDVVVDLRRGSPTFRQSFGVELSADNYRAVYIPAGCAHGFQTLTDDSELFYQMGAIYRPAAARGVRWNDPAFGIAWPLTPTVISERDQAYADFAA